MYYPIASVIKVQYITVITLAIKKI